MDLGRFGVWWSMSWEVASQPDVQVARVLDDLGYGAVWSTGGFRPGLSSRFGRLLAASDRIVVASGITNIWMTPADELAVAVAELERQYPGRFLLGLGASHAPVVQEYAHPYARMVEFLDALDAASPTVTPGRRVLAALGPKMLELAASRSAGAHPYFVPVEHTAFARQVMGTGPLLAPELAVVLEPDPDRARTLARQYATGYLTLPNYVNNLRRLGFTDDDVTGSGSDRLIDAVVAWGDPAAAAARVREHQDAGADHVCLQVIDGGEGFPLSQYEELAAALR